MPRTATADQVAGQAATIDSAHLPSLAPDPTPSHRRSRFDADAGTVLYNEQHADYLLVKDNETALLDYLATLVAKEYVVYNNPRADTDELAEETRPHAHPCPPTSPPATPAAHLTHPAPARAVDGHLESFADLPHAVVAEPAESLHKGPIDALDSVQRHGAQGC